MNGRERPLRVLQIVAMMHSGGPERWLVDLCPAGRAENLVMDIAVLYDMDGLFARRARELGIPVFHCPGAGHPLVFVRNLRRLLREHGPYDAVHCHLHAFSSMAVLAARLAGVPARVVHSHNVTKNSSGTAVRRVYIAASRMLIRMFATAGFAPSKASAEDLFGSDWRRDGRWSVMPCGIDFSPFRAPLAPSASRAALGIPEGALVLGSVGRLTGEKNSELLVDVLAAVAVRGWDAYLLLVGEGPLRDVLEQKARAYGLSDRLKLAGTRSDVPALLKGVVDVFVFPSPPPPRGNEALPIAVVEAQLSGLPTVISDGVPEDAVVIADLVVQIAADAGVDRWAETVLEQARKGKSPAARSLEAMEHSEFNCVQNVKTLASCYRNGSVRAR
jgi:glycosyltransferase involved in cell wall biosynthesis